MASDVRDVLNLPTDGLSSRPTKKQKTGPSRPNLKGLAREVQSLGGDNPIAIVPEISPFKKRKFGSRKPAARWDLTPFRNAAREDGLLLRHWKRQSDEPTTRAASQSNLEGQPMETDSKDDGLDDSAFSKFNVRVDIPEYSDDQYNANLTSDNWSKDETDYLFELARDFDLRWSLIWDRYDYSPRLDKETNGDGTDGTDPNTAIIQAPKPRTMEDLKARYYEVAAKMMAVQKPVHYMSQPEHSLYETMANFNPAQETARKKFAQDSLSRTREEAREEEHLLIEVRRIVARQQKLNQDRQDLYRRLDFPPTEQDITSFKSSAGLSTLLANLANAGDRNKRNNRKAIDSNGANNTPGSAPPNSTPLSDSRRGSIAASTGGGHRDSIGGGERPAKKGAQPPERKKLTEQEEEIYGVSYHDRLPSGPTFRNERINKILTTKSNAQHLRIANTLAELDIPTRLNMPTRKTVDEMEKLLNCISILLDVRKMKDKIDSEVRVERMKNDLKKPPQVKSESATATTTNGHGPNNSLEFTDGDTGASQVADANAAAATTNGNATVNSDKSNERQHSPNFDEHPDDTTAPAAERPTRRTEPLMSPSEIGSSIRPGSSGGHKRSASVLSAVSDNSAKRLKK
ncbi:SWR1-complex protein 4 [Xylariaceae sp. FL0255]|nr:SWR1-complex protein 4 [Xylariaceae sp. FL0255]